MDGLWTEACGPQKQSNDPGNPQYANYWAPLTRKRHTMPHPAQPQHTNYWAPRTRKRHPQEHRPQRPTESSDPTQQAKGRTGDCPGPRKGATTRRNVTQGGGTGGHTPRPPGPLTSGTADGDRGLPLGLRPAFGRCEGRQATAPTSASAPGGPTSCPHPRTQRVAPQQSAVPVAPPASGHNDGSCGRRSCRAVGHCADSSLKTSAVWTLQCVGAITRRRWRDRNGGPTQRLWWIFVTRVGLVEHGNGEKSMDAANCRRAAGSFRGISHRQQPPSAA